MKKPTIEDIKNKTKTYVPAITAGVALGAAIATVIVHKHYSPKDKTMIWLPSDAVVGLKQGRTLIAGNDDNGKYLMRYFPHES